MRLDQGVIDLLNYSFISRVKDTSLKANLRPAVDSTYNLGSNERRFNYVYADNIVASTFLGDVSGNADTVDSYHAYATPTANGLLALDSSLHIPSTVYHEALLVDGSRDLTGNLAVDPGVTIDGVDISAHDADGDIHVDHTTVILTAGAGLTGGGDITTSRTFNVGEGDAITVSADSIAVNAGALVGVGLTTDGGNNLRVGDPTTLSTTTSNSVSASTHEHAVAASSDVTAAGGTSWLLKATTSGYLALARLGIGVSSPTIPLQVYAGPSGVTIPVSDEIATFEDNVNMAVGLYVPDANTIGLKFGTPSATVGGLIQWDYTTGEFRVGTNVAGGDVVMRVGVSSEIARFTSSGLGIGTSPNYLLDIQGTGTQIRVEYTDNLGLSIIADSGGHSYLYSDGNFVFRRLQADTDASFYFRGNNNAFITIASNYDSSGTRQGGILFADQAANKWGLWKGTTNNLQIYDYDETQYILSIANSASVLWTPATAGVFEIRKGGEQLRLAYDGTYYTQFIVNSSGVLTIDAVGDAVVLQTNNKIGSVDFTSQTEGWEMTYAGNLDCRYIYADELRVKAFTAEIYSALIGALVITKSRGRLASDMRIPFGQEAIVGVNQTDDYFIVANNHHSDNTAGLSIVVWGTTGNNGNYIIDHTYYDSVNTQTWVYVTTEIPSAVADGHLNGQTTVYFEDLEELANTAIFDSAGGDWLRFRVMDMSNGGLVVADAWAQAYTYTDLTGVNEGKQSWIIHSRDDGGVMGEYVYRGAIVLDYGQSGDGTWEVTVLDQGNSPYSQVTTWTTDPYTPANHTVWVRTGNLDGIGTLTEQYGIWMGQGTDEGDDAQIIMSNLGARILNLDLYIKSAGTNKVIASSSGYVSAGNVAPTAWGSGAGFWAGMDGTYSKVFAGNWSGSYFAYDASTGYVEVHANANNFVRFSGTTQTFHAGSSQIAYLTINSSPSIRVGEDGGENIYVTASSISMYSGGTQRMSLNNTGTFWIGASSTGTRFQYDTTNGVRLFVGSSAIVQFPTSGDAQIVGTLAVSGTGTITADSGNVILDTGGLHFIDGSASTRVVSWRDGSSNTLSVMYADQGGSTTYWGNTIYAYGTTYPQANYYIQLYGSSTSTNSRALFTWYGQQAYGSVKYRTIMYMDAMYSTGPYHRWEVQFDRNGTNYGKLYFAYQNYAYFSVSAALALFPITSVDGLHIGTYGAAGTPTGEIWQTGDHIMGGGLVVGSSAYTTDVTNGHIWFGDSNLRLYDNGSNYLRIYSNGGTLDIGWSSANSQWNLNAGSGIFTMSTSLYITGGGSIVSGSGGTSGVYASYANSVSNAVRIFKESANGRIDLVVSGTVRLWINYSGDGVASRTVGIGNGNTGFGNIHADNFVNESTRASKRNIRSFKQDIPSALDIVDQMNVLAFEKPNSGSHPNQRRLGMLAEELADVLPEVVAFDKETNVPEGIDYGQIVPLLIEAIKELKEEVRRLS